ncbi:adenylate kinase 8 isoform 1-T1 [Menidia menidia]
MDETVRPLRIPPEMSVYADQHQVAQLMQNLMSSLVIHQPDDPISFLIKELQRSCTDVPRVMLLGPPAIGKHTLALRLSAELRAVHVTPEGLLQDQSGLGTPSEQDPEEQLVHLVPQRLKEVDCSHSGWVLEGFPRTRLQALALQRAGVLPHHVVMLEAPEEVLVERNRGRLVDPLTGSVYHQTFIWPEDQSVAERLEGGRGLADRQLLAELSRHRCEVTGLSSAYQHVLKVVNGDQPHAHVYQQVLAFVRTRHRSRTPRILLLGPPGSGKSLQARLLAQKYRMVDVSCGRLLRAVAAGGSELAEEVQSYLESGQPVPDPLVLQVLEERLTRPDCSSRGWILTGFPSDLQQAQSLKEGLTRPNRVLVLDLTDEVCLDRASLSATDPVSGQRFSALTRPAPPEVQNRLQTAPKDHPQTLRRRLDQYRVQATALQSVFPDSVQIDADQNPHSVFEAIESRLTKD